MAVKRGPSGRGQRPPREAARRGASGDTVAASPAEPAWLGLTFLSVLYLALPYFLFVAGWLWWPYAAVMLAVLGGGVAFAGRRVYRQQDQEVAAALGRRWFDWALVVLFTMALLWIAGIGGVGAQTEDWQKHNAVLHDLVAQPWPVWYAPRPQASQGAYLTYACAYYLPAAAVGKALGLIAAHLALLLWTFLGLLLSAAWLMRLLGSRLWLWWVAWFLLSGMDALGVQARGGGFWCFMEWWTSQGPSPSSGLAQLPSNLSLLVWVPQHMLPAWIATGLIMDQVERFEDLSLSGMVAALTGLWSPFATLGLLPVAIVLLWRGNRRTAWSYANLVAMPAILLLNVLYLESIQVGSLPSQWNFQRFEPSWFLRYYLAFLFLEFGAYALLLVIHFRRGDREALPAGPWNRVWLAMAVITLSLLPLYRVGVLNDLVMRGAISSLFVLWIVLLRTLASRLFRVDFWASSLLLFCLILGGLQPAFLFGFQVLWTRPGLNFYKNSLKATLGDIADWARPQYLGQPEAFFYRHLAKDSRTDAGEPNGEAPPPTSEGNAAKSPPAP